MAFIKDIEANQPDSHQTSPAYMLTFLRWSERDTVNFSNQDKTDRSFLNTRPPLVVINDCIHLSVNSSKSSHIHQASMVLLGGDINYATAIAPGDFVFINMLDNDEHLFGEGKGPNNASSDSLYTRALGAKYINGSHDGFKGVFKVQAVRKIFQTSSEGIKTLHYQITAAAFTEFNQIVYFNPYITFSSEQDQQRATDVLNRLATREWAERTKVTNNLGSSFISLVGFLIGTGFDEDFAPQKKEVVKNFNQSFLMPPKATSLMGLKSKSAKPATASMFFNYFIGIQKYNKSSSNTLEKGLNPEYTTDGTYFRSKEDPPGITILQAEPWAQVTAWSILQQYSNSLLNEMYTSFKLTPNNKVMPCVVFRQKPFTSSGFKKDSATSTTEFLSLPRWNLNANIIRTMSLGRDEVARINFVHIVTKTRYIDLQSEAAQQAAANAQRMNSDDIMRNGLRPFIASCDFDFPTDENKQNNAVPWNKLVYDWLANGHLKENGTVQTVGIEEPIAVGDNCQIDNTVYHIESIDHMMQINAVGQKSFETTLKLSYGVDAREDRVGYNPIYPEMQHTDTYSYRKDNYNNGDGTMSGFSDSQDIIGRSNGEEVKETKQRAFSKIPKTLASKITKSKK